MLTPTMSVVIAIVSIANVVACGWLIWWTARTRPGEVGKGEVGHHVWDGDLQERNNPMPRWWLILFFATIAFAFIYFMLYPALGTFGNSLGWSKAGQYEQEMAAANARYAPIYAAFAGRDIVDLAKDPKALALGHSLFANNCINCHGSDARGAIGFPDLTTHHWKWGGDPESLVQTITHGRGGQMPAWSERLDGATVKMLAVYVHQLGGGK